MFRLFLLFALLFSNTVNAAVPNIFATMASGNVSASTLDANFSFLNSSGSCIQTGTGSGGFGCLLIGPGLTYSTGTLSTGGPGSFTTFTASGQITSTLATGTAPLVVASTTPVTNLSIGGNAATATTATNQSGGTVNATTITGSVSYSLNGVLLFSSTAPTISSGFGTTPLIVNQNGTAAFSVNVGTGGTASAGVIGLPVAAHDWNCAVINPVTGAGTFTQMSALATNSATFTNYTLATAVAVAWPASYILRINCVAK